MVMVLVKVVRSQEVSRAGLIGRVGGSVGTNIIFAFLTCKKLKFAPNSAKVRASCSINFTRSKAEARPDIDTILRSCLLGEINSHKTGKFEISDSNSGAIRAK